MAEEAGARTDGRRLRAARTRAAIARALVTLAGEGETSPSKEQIAERAGVSARAVFLHFPNVLDLVRAEIEGALQAATEPYLYPAGADLDRRASIFVHRAAQMQARMAPVRAMASTLSNLSEPLRVANGKIADQLLVEIDSAFAPELARLDAVDRKDCAIAIAALMAPVHLDEVARLCAKADRGMTEFQTNAVRRLLRRQPD